VFNVSIEKIDLIPHGIPDLPFMDPIFYEDGLGTEGKCVLLTFVKTDDHLDLQSLHRVREHWVMRRTAVINQIRGLLLERGITLRKGRPGKSPPRMPEMA
jgi:hypothetical protein